MKITSFLWIGSGILLLVAISSIIWGYCIYNSKEFSLNLQAEVVGIAIGASLSLLTVAIGFAIESSLRQGALNSARFLFLREDAEDFNTLISTTLWFV